jgi:hypothetical protein
MTRILRNSLILFAFLACGCATTELAHEEDQIRSKLLALYTDQIMDNLIRAKNNLPIIQVDYSSLNGQVTLEATGMIGGSQTVTNANAVTTATAISKMVSRTIATVFNYSLTAHNATQVSMSGTPLNNNNDVYLAYLTFLADQQNLMVTPAAPPEGAAHLCRQYCGSYYWIPCDRATEFFKLSLATTTMRGQPLKVSKDFEITVDHLLGARTINDAKQIHQVLFAIQGKLPNAEGVLRLTVDGIEYKVSTSWVDQTDIDNLKVKDVTAPDYGKDGTLLFFNCSGKNVPLSPDQLAAKLKGQKVSVRLAGFTPPVPTTDALLESIRNETQLIRLNQNLMRP